MRRTTSLSVSLPPPVDWGWLPHGSLRHYNFIRKAPFRLFPLHPCEVFHLMSTVISNDNPGGRTSQDCESSFSSWKFLTHLTERNQINVLNALIRAWASFLFDCVLYNTAGSFWAKFRNGPQTDARAFQFWSNLFFLIRLFTPSSSSLSGIPGGPEIQGWRRPGRKTGRSQK